MARLRLLGLLLVFTSACGNITRKNDSDGGIDSTMIDAPPDAAAPAALEVDVTSFDFGMVTEGTTGTSKMFTIKNNGALPSGTIQAATLTGANPGSWSLISDTCNGTTLAPNATCTIAVQFRPPFAGNLASTLTVMATPGGTATAMLTGIAVTSANLTLTPDFDFGSAIRGASSATKTFTLTNTGGTATGTLTIAPMGTDASQFQIVTNNCGSTLGANSSCTFDGAFAPTSRGMKSATFTAQAVGAGSASATVMGLGQEQYTLTVNKGTSSGTGTIATSPATEINCDLSNTDCTQVYTVGATAPTIALNAVAGTGSRFLAFSNSCTGNTCNVLMDQDRTVTGTFIRVYNLQVTLASVGNGFGTVTSTSSPTQTTQINCTTATSPCNVLFDTGAVVTLTASVTGANRFTGWSGACSGTSPTCNVTMSQAQNVTANFISVQTLTVATSGTGTGTVTSSPAGITCGADCTEPYDYGTSVTLTAAPTLPGSAFVSWSGGGCGTANPCVTTITAATTITAKFDQVIRATWDPVFSGAGLTYSSGNLSVARPSTTIVTKNARSTIGKASGKWYWEVLVDAGVASINAGGIGITEAVTLPTTGYFGTDGLAMSFGYGGNATYYSSFGVGSTNGSPPSSSYIATGIRYMFALDMDNKKLWVGQDGVWYNGGNPSTGINPAMVNLTGTVFAGITFYGNTQAAAGNGFTANFGGSAFTYAVPSGFNAGLYGYPVTWDPAWSPAGVTFSTSNLSISGNTANDKNVRTTVGKTSGKWYWEVKADAGAANTNGGGLGFMDSTHPNNTFIGNVARGFSFGYGTANTQWYFNWTGLSAAGTPPANTAVAAGNVYMFALDVGKQQLFVGMNGTWWNSGDPVAGTGPVAGGFQVSQPVFPGVTLYSNTANAFTAAFFNGYTYGRPPGYAPLID